MLSLSMLTKALFLLPGFVAAYFLRPVAAERDLTARILTYWALAAVIGFGFGNTAMVFICLSVLLLAVVPRQPAAAAIILPGILIALPRGLSWHIPFPGINYLILVDHYRLIALVLLAPAALRAMSGGKRPGRADAIDILVAIYFLLTLLMNYRVAGTVTNGARMTVYLLVDLPLLYFAVTRTLTDWSRVKAAFTALMTGAIALTAASLPGILQNWNHYTSLSAVHGGGVGSAFRGGSWRISGPLTGAEVGLWAGLVGSLSFAHRLRSSAVGWRCFLWVGATIPFIIASQSRAAILAFVTFFLAAYAFKLKSAAMRALYAGGGLLGAFIGYRVLSADGFTAVDEHGTFEYRAMLLEAAARQFANKPLFGTPNYSDSPVFDHLVQGQGIVDFVNGFVQIALAYGGVGLVVFLALIVSTWFGLLKTYDRTVGDSDEARLRRRYAMVMGGAIPSLCLTIFTTSLISYILTTLFLLIALSRALSRLPLPEPAAEDAEPEGEAEEEAPAPAPAPVPVTARARGDLVTAEGDGDWPDGYDPGRIGWPS